GSRADFELLGQRSEVNRERMVAPGRDGMRKTLEDRAAIVSDETRLPVQDSQRGTYLPAVRSPDTLMAETDAQRRSGGAQLRDDPGTRLWVVLRPVGAERPDRNGGIHVSVHGEVADDPSVRAACGPFEVVEDLHRPRLRRAAHGPGREHRRKRVECVVPGRELAFHPGDDVLDVAVPLHRHALRHLDGPKTTHLPEVVAGQVDEHIVLRSLLLVL